MIHLRQFAFTSVTLLTLTFGAAAATVTYGPGAGGPVPPGVPSDPGVFEGGPWSNTTTFNIPDTGSLDQILAPPVATFSTMAGPGGPIDYTSIDITRGTGILGFGFALGDTLTVGGTPSYAPAFTLTPILLDPGDPPTISIPLMGGPFVGAPAGSSIAWTITYTSTGLVGEYDLAAFGTTVINADPSVVPEPGTLVLTGMVFLLTWGSRRLRQQRA